MQSRLTYSLINSVFYTVCLSVCLSVCVSVCLSVCLSVFLSFCLSFRPSVRPSVRLSVCLSVCVSVCLCVCLSVCLSGWLSGCLAVCLAVFYWFYWFNVQYVYTHQALAFLVHDLTSIGGADMGHLAWRHIKTLFLHHTKFSTPPKKIFFLNWRHWLLGMFDISAAFDNVDHAIPLNWKLVSACKAKLKSHLFRVSIREGGIKMISELNWIRGVALYWFASYLSGRSQQVSVHAWHTSSVNMSRMWRTPGFCAI